jgi:integrase
MTSKIAPGSKTIVLNVGGASARIFPDRDGWFTLAWYSPDRRRKRFKTLEEAKEEGRRKLIELNRGRIEAAAAPISDLEQIAAAKKIIAKLGVTVETAVRDYARAAELLAGRDLVSYVRRHVEREVRMELWTVPEAVEKLLEEKAKLNRPPDYLAEIRKMLRPFAQFHPGPVADLTRAHVEEYVAINGNRNGKLEKIRLLLNFCRGRALPKHEATAADDVPFEAITNIREVQIFTVGECKRILAAARRDEILPLAISLFAGIRTDEVARMDWKQVRLSDDPDDSIIEVTRATAKKRERRRFVPILPPLAAYLKKYPHPKAGPVVQIKVLSDRWEYLAKRIGLTWKHNGLRHSFASYRLAATQDMQGLRREMGHTSEQMALNHYVQAVTKAEAGKFWAIRPG